MLVMYMCIKGIDVGYVFVGYMYRCLSCICGLQVSMLVMYLCVIGINVFHVFLGYRYRCWSCISGL